MVGVFIDDREPALAGKLAQLMQLHLWVLVQRRDAYILVQLVSCGHLFLSEETGGCAITRSGQSASPQDVDSEEEIAIAYLAFPLECALACNHVNLTELSK